LTRFSQFAKRLSSYPDSLKNQEQKEHLLRLNGAEMRERILKEAIKLFLHKGFQGTSIKDITDAVSLTKGAIYWHFRSKNELLETILDEWEKLFLSNLIKTVDSIEGDFLAKFKGYQRYSAQFALNHSDLCLAFDILGAEITGSGMQAEERIRRIGRNYHQFIVKLLDEGKRDGWIDEKCETSVQAHVIIAMHKGILVEWYMKRDLVDGNQLAGAFRSAVLAGILSNEKLQEQRAVRDREKRLKREP
jgi:AcrR family transcriptional regulator